MMISSVCERMMNDVNDDLERVYWAGVRNRFVIPDSITFIVVKYARQRVLCYF